MSINLALMKLRQENFKFKTNQGYTAAVVGCFHLVVGLQGQLSHGLFYQTYPK